MKRWICAWMAVLMVMCASFALAQHEIPCFSSFAGGLVWDDDDNPHQDSDSSLSRRYESKSSQLGEVVEEFVQLLQDKYGFKLKTYFVPAASSGSYKMYALEYGKSENVTNFDIYNNSMGWKIIDCSIYLQTWESGSNREVQYWVNNEYKIVDMGDRSKLVASDSQSGKQVTQETSKPAVKPTAKPTAKPSSGGKSCSSCGGDGKISSSCSSCGGDGRKESSCSSCGGDGKKDCMSCSGKGRYDCGGCYNGTSRCGSCSGTGRRSGDRYCSTCGGDGRKTCSSCSGSGTRRCTGCSGSGDRRCSSCSGSGRKESSCSSCSGSGRKNRSCSDCGGDGRR